MKLLAILLFLPLSLKAQTSGCLFAKPLIVGASVSKGYKANPGGPGALIATSINPQAEILNKAVSGARSVESLKDHAIPNHAPSIVVGLDLFFWDAYKNECGESFEENTKFFIKLYQDRGIPMILGKLPQGNDLPKGYQRLPKGCTEKINSFLEKECRMDKNCLLYDPMVCFSEVRDRANRKFASEPEKKEAYLARQYGKYFADSLHTNIKGNKFCAKRFVNEKPYASLTCALGVQLPACP
jgi:hypothetical protein